MLRIKIWPENNKPFKKEDNLSGKSNSIPLPVSDQMTDIENGGISGWISSVSLENTVKNELVPKGSKFLSGSKHKSRPV
jgi:hypothetical protein